MHKDTRNYQQLTEEERYQIMAYLEIGHSQTMIAQRLNRSKSTISREIKRNSIDININLK